ncbi:hypothetical protein DYB35_011484 [Aphanomyces astaci]|uniref:tRNA pseudouridine synthase n=1 Tax=Aphanomyces astaci TaxID=112090 RepID=A0A418CRJ9_APHAT|nr:hypothetical protein DYB35_011484 [Aphanomyces astaci]
MECPPITVAHSIPDFKRMAAPTTTATAAVAYESFSKDNLLEILRRYRHDHPSSVDDMDAIARTIHTPSTTSTPIVRGSGEPAKKKHKADKKAHKPFDFSRYRTRHVALKFSYMGEKYAGFARQDHMEETIERYIIDALTTARLVENFSTCGYSRCGRTDAGVSALSQVIGLMLRSNVPADGTLLDGKSIDDIQAGDTFRAMATAARLLEGQHDYRNFCRMDPTVTNFEREILSFQVLHTSQVSSVDPYYDLCYFEVQGRAFLWHQVRCMAAILFLVGKGHEAPEIVTTLLDIGACPRKPQVRISLFGYMPGAVNRVYHDVENQWEAANLRAALLRNQLDALKRLPVHPHRAIVELQRRQTPQTANHMAALLAYDADVPFGEILPRLPAAGKGLKHIPLLDRKCGFSFEEKMHKVKRKAHLKKMTAQEAATAAAHDDDNTTHSSV